MWQKLVYIFILTYALSLIKSVTESFQCETFHDFKSFDNQV